MAIETSCDDTCAAVLENDRVLASVISSQVDLHKKWGGVVPDLARRAHAERIMAVISEALIRSKIPNSKCQIPNKYQCQKLQDTNKNGSKNDLLKIIEKKIQEVDVVAVTVGPGLAPALEVGVETAKELAKKYNKRLVAVNHIEGHLMSNWINNRFGKPARKMVFPQLALTVSGGHTKLILINQDEQIPNPKFQILKMEKTKDQLREKNQKEKIDFKYQVVGETLDDAAGEALDKAAKLLGLGYPGGPVIERLALKGDKKFLPLPSPMADKKILDLSFSGLKTSFYYKIKDWPKEKVNEHLTDLAASFQEAVIEHLTRKFKLAIEKYQPKLLLASGGVMANRQLRKRLRALAREKGLTIYMPYKKEYNTDNAAMIGVAGYYKALRGEYVENMEELERKPRWEI